MLPCAAIAQAQTVAPPANNQNLTVVYDISIHNNKKAAGIEETYNGGIKTVMVQNGRARVRLVSLMRIQSHYFIKNDSSLAKVFITKESGKKKYKYSLSAREWKDFNTKYDSVSCVLLDDTKEVAGYPCKKAILKIPAQNKEVTIYYTPGLNPLDKHIEPLFATVPGLVLQYETAAGNESIRFTASKLSFEKIDESLLQEPVTGYTQKKP